MVASCLGSKKSWPTNCGKYGKLYFTAFNHCSPCSQHYCLCLYHCLHRCTQFWLAACLSKTFHLSRKPATVCLIIHVVVQVVPNSVILASARAAFLTPNKLPSSLESSREHTVSGHPYWSPPPRAGSRPLLQVSARGACGGAVLKNPSFLQCKPHASPFPSNPFADCIGKVPH
jgi:hypothetical protein